jgi:hypothetical protein
MFPRTFFIGSLTCLMGPMAWAAENLPGPLSPPATSARVDELLGQRQQAAGVKPVELSGDAEFLRRVHFDLCGVLPTVATARGFLSDPRPDKRTRLIDELLDHPDHATHLADTWRHFLLPGDLDAERQAGVRGFQNWLRAQFVRNRRYDNIVADLLVPEDISPSSEAAAASLFYSALQFKPEELAANTSRMFLGVQIQCAQCHDHPMNNWKQKDFWGYAAFFARVRQPQAQARSRMAAIVEATTGEVMLPDTQDVVMPKFLDTQQSRGEDDGSRRRPLAIWLASSSNTYFAKATVNRVWAQLFGRGLVDPVDDLGTHNPASHPQLLEELAAWFVETGFDLKELYRVLANTRAYQLTSQSDEDGAKTPPELFARMAIKNLSAEQLYDALARATLRRDAQGMPGQIATRLDDAQRQLFVSRFRVLAGRPTEFQSGIPQALTLMNGTTVSSATDLMQSPLLQSLQAPFFSHEQRVDVLFLATLSRLPQVDEQHSFVDYVSRASDSNSALGDVLWALLNSAEFTLNH